MLLCITQIGKLLGPALGKTTSGADKDARQWEPSLAAPPALRVATLLGLPVVCACCAVCVCCVVCACCAVLL